MAKDPAFLFYPSDFLIGTQFFTDEQVGQYIRLLLAQHQHGHLSDNQVIFICKSLDNDVINKFSKDESGLYYNKRLDVEKEKRAAFTLSRSQNKAGKTKDMKNTSKSCDSHMVNENENRNNRVVGNKIKGVSFSENLENVILSNGETQELGNDQKVLAKMGNLNPMTIIKGSIY